MRPIEQAKKLISNSEIQEASSNFLDDVVGAILGEPLSIGKLIISIAKSPFFVREQLFWSKMEAFISGTYLYDDDKSKLCAKLTEKGEKGSNALRLVACIDRSETKRKIHYIVNATRCLLSDFIDLQTYFRICHAITYTLEEDLLFLRDHITEDNHLYCLCIQGLLAAGLMYQSVIDGNGEHKYSFVPIAKQLDRFAVSYDDVDRYPDPTKNQEVDVTLHISTPVLEWK